MRFNSARTRRARRVFVSAVTANSVASQATHRITGGEPRWTRRSARWGRMRPGGAERARCELHDVEAPEPVAVPDLVTAGVEGRRAHREVAPVDPRVGRAGRPGRGVEIGHLVGVQEVLDVEHTKAAQDEAASV